MEFRKMRRFKQQLREAETIEIVKKVKTGVLGVLGDDGYPYTVPINYVYENNKIYFHGAKQGHKLDAIRNCNKVSLCIIEKDELVKEELTTYFRSVILFGTARVLETEEEIFHAAKVFGLEFHEDTEKVNNEIKQAWNALCCVEISVEHMTGKEAIELTKARKKCGNPQE